MSRTALATQSTKSFQRSRRLLLSPTKRKSPSDDEQHIHCPSEKEIWEWTLTSAAVAKCYIRDVLTMSQCQGFDFYWLGNTPCRKVEVCGVIVGIQVFEKKIMYTIDDGTEVIDCTDTPQQILKFKNPDMCSTSPGYSLLQPIKGIGGVIKISGRVQRKHETRCMIADEISLSSFGAQLKHWEIVRELHETCYDTSVSFVIPAVQFESSKTSSQAAEPWTPATTTPPTVVDSSPTTVASGKSTKNPHSQPKLRHPSRLRPSNLTDNAFRIYIKHFINNAPETPIKDVFSSDDDLYKSVRVYTSQTGTTTDLTNNDNNSTLRLQIPEKLKCPSLSSFDRICGGFTLSYLRRVPELSLMATRVVRQRARELRKKAQAASAPKSTLPNQPTEHMKLSRASLAAKKKRLFQWAICELMKDGSITLWDGPKRLLRTEGTDQNPENNALWKLSSAAVDTSLFSNANSSRSADDDESYLSDPDPEEEAYISTKPELLAHTITEALKALVLTPPRRQIVKRNELIGGSTKEDILEYLKRDDRWAFIGEWNITETLGYMMKVGLAWNPSGDRWLATG